MDSLPHNRQRAGSAASMLSVVEIAQMVRRRWPLLVASVLLCVGATWYYTQSLVVSYSSSATVTLRTYQNESLFSAVNYVVRDTFLRIPGTELEFVRSDVFRSTADLDSVAGVPVSVSSPDQSNQLIFRATAGDPDSARDAVNAWANGYVAVRLELARTDVAGSLASTEALIADLAAQKAAVLAPLVPIDEAIKTVEDPDVLTRLTTQRLTIQQSLQDELRPVENQLFTLNDSRSNLAIAAQYLTNAEVSAKVTSPGGLGRPSTQSMPRNLFMAGAVGLFLAVGLAVMAEMLRTSVSGRHDVEQLFPRTTIVEVPDHEKRRGGSSLELLSEQSPFSEGIESLVTMLGLVMRNGTGNRILFTSPQSSEGKTTVVASVAARLAMQNIDVIAVDADLRRPRLSEAFGFLNDREGLSSVLAGSTDVFSVLSAPMTGAPLVVIPAGPIHKNPAALIRSSNTGVLFDKLADEAEVVLIDSAPCLPVTDTVALATLAADHLVLLARVGRTRRSELVDAAELLRGTGVNVVSVVVVGVKRRRGYYTYSGSSKKWF